LTQIQQKGVIAKHKASPMNLTTSLQFNNTLLSQTDTFYLFPSKFTSLQILVQKESLKMLERKSQ
jgi:hypothetical protein